MDLRSRHPSIVEQDFLLMDEDENRGKWDIISLSLVVNFVPDPRDRGTHVQCSCYPQFDTTSFRANVMPCTLYVNPRRPTLSCGKQLTWFTSL